MPTNLCSKISRFLVILTILNIVCWFYLYKKHQAGDQISFLNVGQGAATLIQLNHSQQVLIDGGPDEQVLSQLNQLMPPLDRQIELIILTHPHADHLDGILAILKNYQVKNIIHNPVDCQENDCQQFLSLLAKNNIPQFFAHPGLHVKQSKLKIKFFYPATKLQNQTTTTEFNDTSVVLQIKSQNQSVLITGDLPATIEKKLVNSYSTQLISNILAIGHHGSKYSSDPVFLETVQPQTAIISVGQDNKFNHPHPETLEKLNKHNIKTLRTDIDGTITFELN